MFGFGIDKKTLYIIIGILVVISLLSYGTDGIISILLSIPAVLIAITVHEFGHAFTAYKLGDDTPLRQGRLSLNPLDHVDPLGLAMLLFAHIGWGKPVQIDPRNYNRNISVEKADAIVSFGFRFSLSSQSPLINNGNCFAIAVDWNLYLSYNCLAVMSQYFSNFCINIFFTAFL